MAVKILVKRSVSAENAEALKTLINELRVLTTGQQGYISGETLKRVDAPDQSLVISKWQSAEAWKRWLQDERRERIQQQIDRLLKAPTEYEIYEYD